MVEGNLDAMQLVYDTVDALINDSGTKSFQERLKEKLEERAALKKLL